MRKIILNAYAKLNLSLNLIPGRDAGGFFNVRFINTLVSLYDRVSISKNDSGIISVEQFPPMETRENIAYRAAEEMFRSYRLEGGIRIKIVKRIPVRAGLGGGSCDAASVISGIERLYALSLTDKEKISMARKLGMDVCYCVVGGICRITGAGDGITPIPSARLKIKNILIAVPDEKKPSTAWAYSVVDEKEIGKNMQKYERLLEGLNKADVALVAENIWNDFERPVSRHYPVVVEIKKLMLENGALNATLAGSGLSVFGIFPDKKSLKNAGRRLEKTGIRCFDVSTV